MEIKIKRSRELRPEGRVEGGKEEKRGKDSKRGEEKGGKGGLEVKK